jgi:hypothetical protein
MFFDPHTPMVHAGTRLAQRPLSPQAGCQLSPQSATALYGEFLLKPN